MSQKFIPAQFIEDRPIGEDKFKGHSHQRIAENIADFIQNQNLGIRKKLIGLEGAWGSGKSNVIGILDDKILNKGIIDENVKKFIFYTYDAWGHQEDFTKRSFIEELKDTLKGKYIDENYWDRYLKNELATNTITETIDSPRISNELPWIILIFISFPVYRSIFEYLFIKALNWSEYGGFASLCISILLLIVVVYSLYKKSNCTIGELFTFYTGETYKIGRTQTQYSPEPSILKFRKILKEICFHLKDKQLVIVFDNMDRLPADRVRELWSTIYTFFDENDGKSNNLWVIVPFDKDHIGKIFKNEGVESELTCSYIHKTFSITFRVTPPIISDWKEFFDEKIKESFEEIKIDSSILKLIFERFYSGNTVTPRQIINYINGIVVLFNQWEGQIPIKYIAGFYFLKDEILKNPIDKIINMDFSFPLLKPIFSKDKDSAKYFSSLVFNVDPKDADQVLLKPRIEDILRDSTQDYYTIIKHPNFLDILNSSIDVDYNIHNAIGLIIELTNVFGCEKTDPFWSILISNLIQKDQFDWDYFEDEQKILLINSDENYFENLIRYLISSTRGKNFEHFNGKSYVQYIDSLNEFFKAENKDINLKPFLPKVGMKSDEFISALDYSEINYREYSIFLDSSKGDLINFFNRLPLKSFEIYSRFLENSVKYHHFEINSIVQKIREEINLLSNSDDERLEITLNILVPLLKKCSVNNPLEQIIPANIAIWLVQNYTKYQNNYDLILSILQSRDLNFINSSLIKQILNSYDIEQIKILAKESKYYLTAGDFLEFYVNNNLKEIQQIIEKRIELDEELIYDFDFVFENFDKITESISSSEIFEKFFLDMNSKFKDEKQIKNNFITPNFLFCANNYLDSNLSRAVFKLTKDEFAAMDKNTWYMVFSTNYKSIIFQKLLNIIWNMPEDEFLPQNIFEGYCVFVEDYFNRKQVLKFDNSWNIILSHLKPSNSLKRLFKDVRDRLLNFAPGNISEDSILFFEKGIFLYGNIYDSKIKDDFIRKFLLPIIKNEKLFTQIALKRLSEINKLKLEETEYFEEIKNIVIEYIDRSESWDGLANFAKLFGIILKRKLIKKVEIDDSWHLNHWKSNCSKIVNRNIVLYGIDTPKGEGGCHTNINDLLEIGKSYMINCFVKSSNTCTGMFRLWCHDQTGNEIFTKENQSTKFYTPSEKGEIVTLDFNPQINSNIRIHLQYKPGQGQIEVNNVKIFQLID